MKFSELTLDARLQQAIDKSKFENCTPIQEQAIPHILEGRDIAGLAQTGTGKTAAFLIPLMDRILRSIPTDQPLTPEEREKTHQRVFKDWQARNFILVLVPTRELADQVSENLSKLSEFCGLQGVTIYGGTGYDKQKEGLRRNPQFVIATPGRLIDLYKEHQVDLKQVRAIVFDEADRMFDMGFKDDMVYVLHRIPRERQFCVFSATLNFDVLNTAYQFGADPVEINVSRDQAKAENVKDVIFHVGQDEKPQHLISLIKKHNPQQSIIFTNFKLNVERLARYLNENGVHAMAISSLLSQAQRNRVMQQFKATNNMNVLVATDVAARGLDIQGVDLVVNYELPNDPESYVHRIGRTGRAGASGNALSLVSDKDVEALMRIEDYLKHKLEVGYIEDNELIKDLKPMSHDDFSFRPSDRGGERDHRGGPPRRDRDRGPRDRNFRGGRGGDDRRPRGPRHQSQQANGHGGGSSAGQQSGSQGQQAGGGQQQQGHPQGRRPRHQDQPRGEGRQDNRRRHDQKPRAQHSQHNRPARGPKPASPSASAAKSASLGAKVKGFFKRILGS